MKNKMKKTKLVPIKKENVILYFVNFQQIPQLNATQQRSTLISKSQQLAKSQKNNGEQQPRTMGN